MVKKLKSIKSNKMAIGALFSFSGKVCNSIFSYLALLLAAKILGGENFGYYSVVTSVIVLSIQFATVGLDKTVMKFYPIWAKVQQELNKSLNYTIKILFLVIALVVILVNTMGIFIIMTHQNPIGIMLVIMSVNVIFQSIMVYVRAINQSEHNYNRAVLPEDYIRSTLFFGLLLIVYFFIPFEGMEIIVVPLIYSASNALSSFVSLFFLSSIYKKNNLSFSVKRQNVQRKPILSFSLFNMLGNILFHSRNHMILIVASLFVTPESVGQLNIAIKTVAFISFIIVATRNVFGPKISELHAQHDLISLGEIYKKVTNWVSVSGLLICLLLINCSSYIMAVFGYETGERILILLTVSEISTIIFGTVNLFLTMTGKHKQNTILMGICLITGVGLTFLLSPYLGIMGTAVAILISTFVTNISGAFILSRSLGNRIMDSNSMRLLGISMITIFIGYVLNLQVSFSLYFNLLIVGVTTVFSYGLLNALVFHKYGRNAHG